MASLLSAVAGSIILCYTVMIVLPLCCYWVYELYRRKHEMFMQKRNAKMTIALNISLISYIFFSAWNLVHHAYIVHDEIDFWMSVGIGMVLYMTLWIFLYFLLCKSWIIYYNYKWTYYTLSVEWETIINTRSHEQNWYLKHRARYGNLRWVAKVLLIVFLLFFFITFWGGNMMYSDDEIQAMIGLIMTMITMSIPIISYIFILCKTPNSQKFNDLFFIHWESKVIAKLLGLFLIYFIMAWIVTAFINSTFDPNSNESAMLHITGTFISSTYLTLVIYVGTKLIIHKNIELELVGNMESTEREHSYSASSVSKRSILLKILSNKDAIHLFMNHLSFEYSMEILLSFIEFTQYNDYLEKHISNTEISTESTITATNFNDLKLCETLPISSIVENKNDSHDFKRKAYELYAKYVAVGSIYEINISGHLHNEFANLMNDYNAFQQINVNTNDMLKLFEKCRIEMFQLLLYAHARFTGRDQEYNKLERIIYPQNI